MNIQIPNFTQLERSYNRYFTKGNFKEAIQVAQQLLEEGTSQENIQILMTAHLHLAYSHFCLGDIENAFQHVLHYKDLCGDHGNTRENYYLYYINAYIYEYEENYDTAKEALERCIDIALEHGIYDGLCASYNLYNHILVMNGEFERAAKSALQAKKLACQYCPNDLYIQCQNDTILATAQIELGQYQEAALLLKQLAQQPISLNNQRERSRYLFAQGLYHLRTNQLEEAIYYLQEAKKVSHALNDQLMLKRIIFHLVEIYELLEDYPTALCRLKEYVQINEDLHKIRLASKITELDLRHSISIIERRANFDALSGVYNRYYLEQITNTWLEKAKEKGDHICCIVFDVDNFKHINDYYGHLFGDEVIKMIGGTCKKVLRKNESLIARYGGDEFIVILKNYGREQIMSTAQVLFEKLTNTPVIMENQSFNISVSMGLVCNDSVPAKKFTQLFRVADQALYMAKNQGKNQIVSMSNMNCTI